MPLWEVRISSTPVMAGCSQIQTMYFGGSTIICKREYLYCSNHLLMHRKSQLYLYNTQSKPNWLFNTRPVMGVLQADWLVFENIEKATLTYLK